MDWMETMEDGLDWIAYYDILHWYITTTIYVEYKIIIAKKSKSSSETQRRQIAENPRMRTVFGSTSM